MLKPTQVVNVRLTVDEIRQIDSLAKEDDRSRSYMIRKLIRLSLSELQGNGQPHHEGDAE